MLRLSIWVGPHAFIFVKVLRILKNSSKNHTIFRFYIPPPHSHQRFPLCHSKIGCVVYAEHEIDAHKYTYVRYVNANTGTYYLNTYT